MLRSVLQGYNVILASGSPRRQQFFRELDIDFEISIREVDEVYPDHLKRQEISDYLSILKADAFDGTLLDNDILITSDTIVWHNGKALGKPKDFDDAIAILRELSAATHEVITSVCIKTTRETVVFHECTEVTFNPLDDAEIKYYLQKCKPFDKAGAYGIQDWIGLTTVVRINGSYPNVMGMPVDKVYQHLKQFGK